MKRKPKHASKFVEELTPEELDTLWTGAAPYMAINDDESVQQALSGNDPGAARAYIYWLTHHLRTGQPISSSTRAFAIGALDRFGGFSRLTLGQAFGVERMTRGNPPTRRGAFSAVVGLIQYLHEQCGFALSESADRSSAFEVASVLLERRWKYRRTPLTLRDQFWNKRDKGEKR